MIEIGVMGGAFRPIHNWHLTLADWSRYRFSLEKVYFVPSGQPPHKKEGALDKEVRFEMVQAAVASNPYFIASRLEVDRPGVSWTIDTLRELKKQLGDGVRLNFIMGEDNIKSMANYDLRAEFQGLARLLVSPRGRYDATLLASWRQQLPDGEIEIIDCPPSNLSSTLVRGWIAAGEPYRYAVPEPVYKIIEERKLYRPSQEAASSSAAAVVESNGASTEDSLQNRKADEAGTPTGSVDNGSEKNAAA